MSHKTIISEVRKVENGYIAEARWPYGGEVMGDGEVVCKTLREVFLLMLKCARTGFDSENIEIDQLESLLKEPK